ncbi:MAG: ZIP family metal transporter [Methylococcales bacterium]|nr:ZIP family metal transporter [Methylococcales bacterium]
MSVLLGIIVFTALGGVLSVLAAASFLLLNAHWQARLLPHGISFATGALLTAAFWSLLPHALEDMPEAQIPGLMLTVLGGILLFFTLEKLLIWRHCHHPGEDHHGQHDPKPAGLFILLGDAMHNFVDGVLIAAAFLTDFQLGMVTSLAVAAHEIPQEVGDFAILLESGYSKKRALLYNMLASLSTVVGGVLAYYGLDALSGGLPYLLALAAASFIYIAVADLIPTLHQQTDFSTSAKQLLLIGAGVLLILVLSVFAHQFIPD